MSRFFSQVNRCVEVWNDHHLREWCLTIMGAVVFIAGSIVGTIALRNNTLPWAVFDFVMGIAGLIIFFTSALELFFKITSSVMMSFQETLAQQMVIAHQKSTVDVGTMTTSPKESQRMPMNHPPKEDRKMLMDFTPTENRKMLMTFPSIDRSKSLACERHPQMKDRALLNTQEKNDLEASQTEQFQCPVSVHASEDNSQEEPLYYDFDDSYNMESLAVKDSSTNKLSKDGTLKLQEFLANGLRFHYESRNFLRCIKTLHLSPGKKYSVASKFQALSSKLMRRKMISSSPEWEMSLIASGTHVRQENLPSFSTSEDDTSPDVGQTFVAKSSDIKSDILPHLSLNRDEQTDLKSTSQASAVTCSTVSSTQNRASNHFHENFKVSMDDQQQHPMCMEKMSESLLENKPSKCNEVYLPNKCKSSDFTEQVSSESNRESDAFISNSDQLPPSTDSSSDTINNRKMYSRSKRKPLVNLSPSTQHPLENLDSEHVKRFY